MRQRITVLAIAASLASGSSVFAQDDGEPAVAVDEPGSDRLSVSLDLGFTNNYYWRGIVQQKDEFIVQPGIELAYLLHAGEDVSFGVTVGTWNSFGDQNEGMGDGFVGNWYENDLYAALTAEWGRWSADATYTVYASPNDTFTNVDELSIGIGFDDSGLWGNDFALNPSARVAFELDGAADGGEEGTYLELAVEPGLELGETGFGPLSLAIPVTVGLSLSDYYEDSAGDDSAFGYVDVGADLTLDIPDPQGAGDWSLHAGVHGLFLGDETENYNSDDSAELLISGGLLISF